MEEPRNKSFHDELKTIIDQFVHGVYDATKDFPKDELFGITSQLRRAALSVALNYIEGYARQRSAVTKNFFEIAYGSLKESDYLLVFARKRGFMGEKSADELVKLADRIGGMLWSTIKKIKV
ncbi:MAG: four helix bundle protein [Candidatus Jorgensenbacteria bacterium]